jgi:cytochrome c553
VGQTVGHMLDHQRAADHLMQGLIVPSSTLWNQGAQGLRQAPLSNGKLPKDQKLTADVAAGELHVHQLGDRAAGTSDPQARSALYGELLGTCARCHSLHQNIWGPTKR